MKATINTSAMQATPALQNRRIIAGNQAARNCRRRRRCGAEVMRSAARAILVAEEHDLLASALYVLLKSLDPGLRRLRARDGSEAIALARTHQPDLALLSLTLPKLDTLEVIHEIRKLAPESGIAIMVMDDNPFVKARILIKGGDACVAKPRLYDDLSAFLGTFGRRKRRGARP